MQDKGWSAHCRDRVAFAGMRLGIIHLDRLRGFEFRAIGIGAVVAIGAIGVGECRRGSESALGELPEQASVARPQRPSGYARHDAPRSCSGHQPSTRRDSPAEDSDPRPAGRSGLLPPGFVSDAADAPSTFSDS